MPVYQLPIKIDKNNVGNGRESVSRQVEGGVRFMHTAIRKLGIFALSLLFGMWLKIETFSNYSTDW